MTNEEAIKTLKGEVWINCQEKWFEALDMAIKALEQEPCDDAISRQAVLDIINFEDKWLLDAKGHNADTEIAFSGMKSKVSALPSVNPQEPCDDAINRQAVIGLIADYDLSMEQVVKGIFALPPVNPQEPKTGHCKDCKYFEYDSVAKVDGIPLIVAHEICSRWGDGCKTREDGYCFLFEPKENDHKCHTCKHYMSGEYDGSCDSYICEHYSDWEARDKE